MLGTHKKSWAPEAKLGPRGKKPIFQGRLRLIAPLNFGLTKNLLNTKIHNWWGLHKRISFLALAPPGPSSQN